MRYEIDQSQGPDFPSRSSTSRVLPTAVYVPAKQQLHARDISSKFCAMEAAFVYIYVRLCRASI